MSPQTLLVSLQLLVSHLSIQMVNLMNEDSLLQSRNWSSISWIGVFQVEARVQYSAKSQLGLVRKDRLSKAPTFEDMPFWQHLN